MHDEYIKPGLPWPMQRSVRPPTDKQLRQLSAKQMFELAMRLNQGKKRKLVKDALLPLISSRTNTPSNG